MANMLPITPKEAVKETIIPDVVFEAFNALILENLSGKSSRVFLDDVAKALVKKESGWNEIFGEGKFTVMRAYRKAGWKVEYDDPGYDSYHNGHLVFSKP